MIVSPIFFKVVSMLNRASSPNHYFQTSLTVKGTIISVSDIVNPFLSGIELMYLRSTSFEKRSLSSSVSGTIGVVLFVGAGLGTIGVVLLVTGTFGTIGTGMNGIIGIVVLVVGTTGLGTIGVVLLVVVLLVVGTAGLGTIGIVLLLVVLVVVGTGLGAIGIGVGAIGIVLLVLGTFVFGLSAASILICS